MMIPGEDSVPLIMTLSVKYLTACPLALKHITEENMEMKKKILLEESYEWSDYTSLEFTQNVINETLRLANIVNGVWSIALKDVEIKCESIYWLFDCMITHYPSLLEIRIQTRTPCWHGAPLNQVLSFPGKGCRMPQQIHALWWRAEALPWSGACKAKSLHFSTSFCH